jgi:hypothetical protein
MTGVHGTQKTGEIHAEVRLIELVIVAATIGETGKMLIMSLVDLIAVHEVINAMILNKIAN